MGTYLSVAIEVEITRKIKSKYADAAESYSDLESVHRILWLVPAQSDARHIQSAMRNSEMENRDKHDFVLVPDFKTVGWQSKITLGPEAGKTVQEFLNSLPQKPVSNVTDSPSFEFTKKFCKIQEFTKNVTDPRIATG